VRDRSDLRVDQRQNAAERVSRVMRWLLEGSLLESSVIADIRDVRLVRRLGAMTEKTLNLRGLNARCRAPGRKALARSSPATFYRRMHRPPTAIDIPPYRPADSWKDQQGQEAFDVR